VLNGRIYRAALVLPLLALAIVAFSLTDRPGPLTATLAPDAFDGARALAEAQSLAARFPARRPGSSGDRALAAYVAQTLRGLGGTADGGFQVHVRRVSAQTIDGPRTLETVLAERPGSGDGAPIAILAHRDAAARGALAEMSGTAALLELARVFAVSDTQRTIVLVSTSGGSGGAAGARDFAEHARGPVDGAIVLGDLAGSLARRPFVVPFSSAIGSAPLRLQSTVAGALAQETGSDPGAPSTLGQLAHLTLPLTVGEQGPLQAAGIPAVLVQVSGEIGPPAPPARDPVSAATLQGFGRGVLSAVYALDGGPDVAAAGGAATSVPVEHKLLPGWAVRLLLAALLLPPLLVTIDGLARLRRRRKRVGRWIAWVLACALPFLAAALFVRLLGLTGAIAAPQGAVPAAALPAGALATAFAAALVLALAWLAWPALLRRLHLAPRPSSDAAGVALLLVLLALAFVVWLFNPFTAALLVLPLNLWLALVGTGWRPSGRLLARAAPLALVACSLAPLALLLAFYATRLGYAPGALPGALAELVAGGYLGVLGLLLWSVALGCVAAATLLALRPAPYAIGEGEPHDGALITIRGPASYAGPGSLGGTESALRR
jgi:hypothetical protein